MNGAVPGVPASLSVFAFDPDAWLRLARSGDAIFAFKSSDGVERILVGSLTAEFPPTCYFGLATASGSIEVENTAVFNYGFVIS